MVCHHVIAQREGKRDSDPVEMDRVGTGEMGDNLDRRDPDGGLWRNRSTFLSCPKVNIIRVNKK